MSKIGEKWVKGTDYRGRTTKKTKVITRSQLRLTTTGKSKKY